MKMNGNEIRQGNIIKHQDTLWVAVKCNAVKPGKGGAFNQVELKNLLDGRKLNERFRAAETVERVRLDQKTHTYLYADGDMLVFMNAETYEQINLQSEFVGERAKFLNDGMEVEVEPNLWSKARPPRIPINRLHLKTVYEQRFPLLSALANAL